MTVMPPRRHGMSVSIAYNDYLAKRLAARQEGNTMLEAALQLDMHS